MGRPRNEQRQLGLGERAPWGDFPPVVANGPLGSLDEQPEYAAAKAGDEQAALDVVERVMCRETVAVLRERLAGNTVTVVPVLAEEQAGRNKLPVAAGRILAEELGADATLATHIIQIDRVHRTGSGADHRLAFNPRFSGRVTPGERYLIVDDTLAMGGTLASLRGYLENRGGQVISGIAMSAHPGACDLAVKPGMLQGIHAKHGDAPDAFWKETFGYGIDRLTQGEAGHIRKAGSFDAIRTRILAARDEGLRRVDRARVSPPARSPRTRSPFER